MNLGGAFNRPFCLLVGNLAAPSETADRFGRSGLARKVVPKRRPYTPAPGHSRPPTNWAKIAARRSVIFTQLRLDSGDQATRLPISPMARI